MSEWGALGRGEGGGLSGASVLYLLAPEECRAQLLGYLCRGEGVGGVRAGEYRGEVEVKGW